MSVNGQDRRGAWRAALACMVTLAVAMGLGRFAFTPMLPIMLGEGKLELAGGGVLASLNYLGYFLGAVSCAAIGIKASSMVRGGLAATAALLIGMGLLHSFAGWGILRAAAGVMSAWVFVFASGWGLRRLAETNSPTLAGVIYTGPGIGIAMTGLLGGALGRWGSEVGWIGLGLLAVVLIAIIWRVFDDGEVAQGGGAKAPATASSSATASGADRSDAIWLVALYGLAGFGYIITATFLPVIARQALPGSNWPDLFWPLFGICVSIGAFLATRLPTHWDNRLLLAACYLLQACGILIGIVSPSVTGFALGSILLGMPFTAIPLFAMRDARRLRGDHARSLMGMLTAAYGVGQIIGPPLATRLVRSSGSFTSSLSVAALALLAGAILLSAMYRHSSKLAG